MKAIIPVAGAGTRLRPHTYTQPKPLIPVAGKPIICFIVDKLVAAGVRDFVCVIGYLGDKIRDFLVKKYPELNFEFIFQENREGSGHAVWTARESIKDEDAIFIAFGDTIFDVNLQNFLDEPTSCFGIKKVADPRDFGVAEFDENGMATRLVEKPKIPKSNMALVGLYKITEVQKLISAIEYLIEHNIRTVGEIQLTDAMQRLIEQKVPFKTLAVNNWYDCGRKQVLLETNAMLLSREGYTPDLPEFDNTIIIHPVAIGENCVISNSIIGPHVTIGNDVNIQSSIVKDSIVGHFAHLDDVVLRHSVIGSDAQIKGMNLSLNIGDNTEIDFG
jgi:glucose-1-phosphate thymidylyltransferase